MHHLDDKELDRLSAAAAENYTPPGSPSWDALEQTLDKELPQEKERKRRGLFLFFLLPGLFLGGAIYWYSRPAATSPVAVTSKNTSINNSNNNNTSNRNSNSVNSNNSNSHTLLPSQKPVLMPNSHESAAIPSKNDNNTSHTKTSNNSTTTNKTADKKAADIAYQPARKASNNEKQVIPAAADRGAKIRKQPGKLVYSPLTDRNNTAENGVSTNGSKAPRGNRYKGKRSNTPAATDALIAGNDHADQLNGTGNGQTVNGDQPNTQKNNPPVTTPANTTAANKPVVPTTTDSAATVKTPAPATDTAAKQAPAQVANKKKKNNDKALSIGITGGVDMSTVKFDYGNNAGYNIGLMAGYHFNKNWSVYTGAIYTKKKYKMDGDNYNAPSGTWPSYYKIDMVNGYCQMWELPLMGRYTFNSRTSTRLFAGAGISSYLMNKEYYSYDYKRLGVPATGDWTNNNKSQFWFSVLDLSAGIEKPLGHHLVGQIEPYAKLPLKGLGTGKIMLSSFGLNLTLQYRKKLGK